MKHFLFILALALSACANPADNAPKATVSEAATPAAATAAAGTQLVFSQENSTLDFTGSKVTGSESGSFKQFKGTLELVAEQVERSRVTVEIVMDSVVTQAAGLAEHLKTPDFFAVEQFPKATFVSTEIKPGGGNATHTVTGVLELHGVKKTIAFPATINVASDAVTVASTFAINRKDFGIVYAGRTNDLIRDEVVLKLAVRAPRR